MKRFKACHVRARRVEGVADGVQELEGLKRVAAVLRSSGLVQVDEGKRTFGMHQLLQQAVGRQLGWQEQRQRMRQLLQARCGRFGDEDDFDVGLYGVMREVAAAAVVAVRRVKEEGAEAGDAWCSGMLLRLYEVAREVYGAEAEFPERVLAAAHGSLVADLVLEEVMREGGRRAGRRMTLRELVDAAPQVRDVIAHNPEFKADEDDHRAILEEMTKGASRYAAGDIVFVRRFDVEKCVRSQWRRGVRALLGARGLRVVDDGGGGGGCRVEVEEGAEAGVGASGDGGLVVGGHGLRAMRWRFHTLSGNVESYERMMEEICGVYDGEAEGEGKWQVGVALGAACDRVAYSYLRYFDEKHWKDMIAALERALRMRLDTLGEQHPATAVTFASMGTAYGNMGSHDTNIMLQERALRIKKITLGLHPETALTMSSIGAAYGNKGQHKKAIELYEQALRIYERTVGRMHHYAAYAISNMSWAYYHLGDLVKAEELGKEALVINDNTLGPDHKETKEARDSLDNIQKAKSRGGGSVK